MMLIVVFTSDPPFSKYHILDALNSFVSSRSSCVVLLEEKEEEEESAMI